jgi:uncharacterized protein YacL
MFTEIDTALLLIVIGLLVYHRDMSSLPKRKSSGGGVVLDSCVLIDGRVLDVADAHFIPKRIIIPQFILQELQLLADGKDKYKRERARFGLDVAHQLQQQAGFDVSIDSLDFPGSMAVDDKLVKLALKRSAYLCTTDFNLNKIALIAGVTVLNVNELAQTLRTVILPGEATTVKLLQKGKARGQAIGYFDDGTMIVVDNAGHLIGKTVSVTITGMHQTMAGKMAFGKLIST